MTSRVDRAVTPVLGVAILLAVGIGVATFVSVVALDATPEDPGEDRAALFDAEFDATEPELQFAHVAGRALYGERVVVVDDDGNTATWQELHADDADAVEGESITLPPEWPAGSGVDLVDLCAQDAGYTYHLNRTTGSGEHLEVLEYSLPEEPAACP